MREERIYLPPTMCVWGGGRGGHICLPPTLCVWGGGRGEGISTYPLPCGVRGGHIYLPPTRAPVLPVTCIHSLSSAVPLLPLRP